MRMIRSDGVVKCCQWKLYKMFSVAHRLSSIRSVNKIYVLVDGEIAEQGCLSLLPEIN